MSRSYRMPSHSTLWGFYLLSFNYENETIPTIFTAILSSTIVSGVHTTKPFSDQCNVLMLSHGVIRSETISLSFRSIAGQLLRVLRGVLLLFMDGCLKEDLKFLKTILVSRLLPQGRLCQLMTDSMIPRIWIRSEIGETILWQSIKCCFADLIIKWIHFLPRSF